MGAIRMSSAFLRGLSWLAVVTLAVVTLAAGGAYAQAINSPNAVVESAIAELTAALEGNREALAEDEAALHDLIDEILLPRFDRKYAARLVLGKHWRAADDSQRERFVETFYRALLRKYADGILQYEPDRVEVLPFRGDATRQRTTVRTNVKLDDGTDAKVNYGLVMRDAGWLLFDVTIEGISYVRNFRAELDSEIRSTSLEAVITRFENEAGTVASE